MQKTLGYFKKEIIPKATIKCKPISCKAVVAIQFYIVCGCKKKETKFNSLFLPLQDFELAFLATLISLSQVCPPFLDKTWLIHVHYNLYGCHAKSILLGR